MNEWWKFWWVNKNLCQVIQLVSPWRNCVHDLQASNTLKTTKEKHFISTWNVIVWVSVLQKRIVVDSDRHFDNLWGSHLQNQSELYHVSWWYLFFLPLWGIRNYLSKKKEIRGRDNSRTGEGHKRDSRRTQGTQEGHQRVQGVHYRGTRRKLKGHNKNTKGAKGVKYRGTRRKLEEHSRTRGAPQGKRGEI